MMLNDKPNEATTPNNERTAWSEEEYYDKEIVPKLEELVKLLDARQLPHLVFVCYKDDVKSFGAGTMSNTHKRPFIRGIVNAARAVIAGKAIAIPEEQISETFINLITGLRSRQ